MLRPSHRRSIFTLLMTSVFLTACATSGSDYERLESLPVDSHLSQEKLMDMQKQYNEDPSNIPLAIYYSKVLRANNRKEQAVAILQTLTLKHPNNTSLLSAYGKSLIDVGESKQATTILKNAYMPESPDWTILSALGVASDQLGDHTVAQRYYIEALKFKPNEPSILGNLGLSYALNGDLEQARQTLLKASLMPGATRKVKANLRLVENLQKGQNDIPSKRSIQISKLPQKIDHSPKKQTVTKPNTQRLKQKITSSPDKALYHQTQEDRKLVLEELKKQHL